MRAATLAAVFTCALSGQALAWGQEGHSIVAEIAQHRLSPEADTIIGLFARGGTCTGSCAPRHTYMKFHAAWDSGLIMRTVWDWARYVDLLETGSGSLATTEAQANGGTPEQWADETHKAAQTIWALLPENSILDDACDQKVSSIVARQLGVASLRLAKFLNDAYASNQCPVPDAAAGHAIATEVE